MSEETSALSGAIGGGAAGAATGNPYAIAAGILGGGLFGWQAGSDQEEANDLQKAAIERARQQLNQTAAQQYKNRMASLDRVMSMYAPVNATFANMKNLPGRELYNQPTAAGLPGAPAVGSPANATSWNDIWSGKPPNGYDPMGYMPLSSLDMFGPQLPQQQQQAQPVNPYGPVVTANSPANKMSPDAAATALGGRTLRGG